MDFKKIYQAAKQITEQAFIDMIEKEIESTAIELGVERTIASMHDAGVKRDQIVHMLIKHWNLSLEEAEERIRQDAVMIFPYRKFMAFYKEEGYSSDRIYAFWCECDVKNELDKDPELAKKEPAALYDHFSKKCNITL